MSIPLYNTADYVSTVASLVSATQFTMTGAAWTPGAYATAAAPRIVRVKASTAVPAHVGKYFVVSDNTANQLTVVLPFGVADISTAISVGDICELVPANTLGSVFGTTTPILHGDPDSTLADSVYILNGGAWETYFHNGTNWRKFGGAGNKNNNIIYPDEGLFIVHVSTSPVVLTLMGTVPSTGEQSDLLGNNASTFLANRFPVDMQLVNTGLHLLPGWVTGAVDDADLVYVWDSAVSQWATYFHNGTNWRRSGASGNKNTDLIPSGTAVVVSRHAASTATLSQTLPYTP